MNVHFTSVCLVPPVSSLFPPRYLLFMMLAEACFEAGQDHFVDLQSSSQDGASAVLLNGSGCGSL